MILSSTLSSFLGTVIELAPDARYQVIEYIGMANLSLVWLTRELSSPDSDPIYRALKVSRAKVSGKPGTRALLRREMILHRHVSDHPNVLTLHEAYEDKYFTYFVLDYAPFHSLLEHVSIRKIFYRNDELVRKVFVEILDVVSSCHQRGVFHRDLRPDNIMCSKDGSQVYLTQFSYATNSETSMRHGCGTPAYMSPENMGEAYDYAPYSTKHNDIWSLGVILVNLLTGCNPWGMPTYDDPDFWDFMHNPFFFYHTFDISLEANAILERLFDLDPFARISISELREEVINIETFFTPRDEDADNLESVQRSPSMPSFTVMSESKETLNSNQQSDLECPTKDVTSEGNIHNAVLAVAEPTQAAIDAALSTSQIDTPRSMMTCCSALDGDIASSRISNYYVAREALAQAITLLAALLSLFTVPAELQENRCTRPRQKQKTYDAQSTRCFAAV